VPDPPDAVEEMLLCLVEVLCQRSIEPARAGRGPDIIRALPIPRPSFDSSNASTVRFSPSMALFPPVIGNCPMRLLDAEVILLWRSSKLGEGRNS
jgi:hypothetical protein